MEADDTHLDRNSEFVRHAQTYHRFMLAVKWAMIHMASILAFLTIWFATPGGFFGGLVVGVAIFAAGVWAMRHGLAHSSDEEMPLPGSQPERSST